MKSFQERVMSWARACFGEADATDLHQRGVRFLEEALELAQSVGVNAAQARAVLEYVYARPVGETRQEVGGTMVTLACLCESLHLPMADVAEAELARCEQNMRGIAKRHQYKPRFTDAELEQKRAQRVNAAAGAGTYTFPNCAVVPPRAVFGPCRGK